MKEKLLLLLCLLLPMAASGADYFYSTTEDGVDLLYQVIDENSKLCALGYYRESDKTAYPAIQTKGANPTELTIPQVVEGYTVVAVCPKAFYNNSPGNSKLERLTLPETVVLIGTNAFTYNAKLREFHWPSTLQEIGDQAFYGCAALENLDLPQSVKSIGRSAFSNCTGLERVTLPSSLIELWQSAINKCTNLRTVVVGNCPINYSDLWDSNVLDYVEELELHLTNIGSTSKSFDYLRTLALGDEVRTIGQSFAK
ncbi:MAG: leucine-rich repeat protein, partial [Alloprevotella sp.]|nr:leucine-rich repeat protein [Alloprevotella sp.]